MCIRDSNSSLPKITFCICAVAIGDDQWQGDFLIIAYGNGTDAERDFWQRTIGDGAFADGDFDTACSILDRYHAIDRSVTEAGKYAGAAAAALDRIADQTNTGQISAITALLDALSEAARFAAHRQN